MGVCLPPELSEDWERVDCWLVSSSMGWPSGPVVSTLVTGAAFLASLLSLVWSELGLEGGTLLAVVEAGPGYPGYPGPGCPGG